MSCCSLEQLVYLSTTRFVCQPVFLSFLNFLNCSNCLNFFFISNSFVSLSQAFLFVNNFFNFFQKFLLLNGDGGIWTLAPVTRPTPLAGAPLQPLEYISLPENSLPRYSIFPLQTSYFYACAKISLAKNPSSVNAFFSFFENNFLYCLYSRHNLFYALYLVLSI